MLRIVRKNVGRAVRALVYKARTARPITDIHRQE